MLFGKSLFQSVVDRLSHEADIEQETPSQKATDFRIRGFGSGFVTERPEAATDAPGRGAAAYLQIMEDYETRLTAAAETRRPVPPTPPAWIHRLSVEEIAADLAIAPDDSHEMLLEKRRIFARQNHPDGIDARFAEAATTRMKVANQLIDDAIRTRRLQS